MLLALRRFFLENTRELVALGVVLAAALFLRLSRLPAEIIWNGDTARDFLVARHLWLYHEPLSIGHSAYGLRIDTPKNEGDPYGMSHYPSYYLRAMSLLWGVTGDPTRLSVVIVLYQVAGLGALYLGLRKVAGSLPALSAVTVIALSVKAIEHSLGAAIHPSLPLFFTVLTLFLYGWTTQKLRYTVSAALLCILATLIHYSFLICFIWIWALTVWQLWQKKERPQLIRFGAGIAGIGAALFLLLHLEIIRFYGFGPFLGTFTGQLNSGSVLLSQLFPHFMDTLMFRLRGLFPLQTTAMAALVIGTGAFAAAGRKNTRPLLLGLLSFAFSLIFLVSLKAFNTYHYEQVVFVDYVLMVVFGLSIGLLLQEKSPELRLGAVVVAGVVLTSLTSSWYQHPPVFLTLPISAARDQAEQLLHQSPTPLENTEFYVSSYYSWDYETPTVLYWLEVLSDKKLVKLVDVYNNIGWPEPAKQYMIASCQRFPLNPAMERNSCQVFLQHFEDTSKYKLERELFTNDYYRTYLFKIN